MSRSPPKFIVKERSWNVPTRVKTGWSRTGGWHDAVRWGPWRTVARFDSPSAAFEAARAQKYTVGFTRAAVFYRGVRLSVRELGGLIIAERERTRALETPP